MAIFEFLHLTRFHLYMCAVWQFGIYMATQQIFGIFMNYTPEWRCEQEEYDTEWAKNCSVWEMCDRYNLTLNRAPFFSAVEEFGMICGKDGYFAAVISTLQFLGVLFGTISFGHLGDRFGRKKVTCAALIAGVTVASLSGASVNWQMLAALRFLVGLCIGGIIVVGYSYVIELILPEQRLFLRGFFNYGNSRLMMTLICYLVPHWRYAAFATALPISGMLFMILLAVPESPKWFESRRQHNKAIEALNKIAKFNGKKPDENVALEPLQQQSDTQQTRTYTIKDLFATKRMAIRTLTLCFIWFTASMSGFANDLNSSNLAGDFYLNQFLMSILIAVSKVLLFFMDTYIPKFSRRMLHQVPQFLICICYLIIMILIIFEMNPLAVTGINIFSIILIEYTWDACYLCAAEGFPTVVRSIGIGTCSLMARVGAILAPQMAYLSNLWNGAPFAAVVVCGFISLTLSYLYLPETKDCELDDLFPSDLGSEETQTKDKEIVLTS